MVSLMNKLDKCFDKLGINLNKTKFILNCYHKDYKDHNDPFIEFYLCHKDNPKNIRFVLDSKYLIVPFNDTNYKFLHIPYTSKNLEELLIKSYYFIQKVQLKEEELNSFNNIEEFFKFCKSKHMYNMKRFKNECYTIGRFFIEQTHIKDYFNLYALYFNEKILIGNNLYFKNIINILENIYHVLS